MQTEQYNICVRGRNTGEGRQLLEVCVSQSTVVLCIIIGMDEVF